MAKIEHLVNSGDIFDFVSGELSWKSLYYKKFPRWLKRALWLPPILLFLCLGCLIWASCDGGITSALILLGIGMLYYWSLWYILDKAIKEGENILKAEGYSSMWELKMNKFAAHLKKKKCYNIHDINILKEVFTHKAEESKRLLSISNAIPYAILLMMLSALYNRYLDLKVENLKVLCLYFPTFIKHFSFILLPFIGYLATKKQVDKITINRKSHKYREAISLLNTLLLNQKGLQRSPLHSTKKHKQVKNSL